MSENKTKQTNQDVYQFIDKWVESEQKRKDSHDLIAMMERVTGKPPRMWGPTMIGFGQYHYVSPGGRAGDWPAVAFSPRKAALTLYAVTDTERYADQIATLGKVKTSKACIYINKLSDVDTVKLEALVAEAYEDLKREFAAS